eukprot:Tbor_TRINITY_DN5945_c2_g9::TRINITY_DN5945_c2_g9_i1::g.18904::m.18904
MLRRPLPILLARPYGPLSGRRDVEPARNLENRSELIMVKYNRKHHFNCNMRERFSSGQNPSGLHAIPRDYGELVRDYMIKILSRNEPITCADLFIILKEAPDCPFDSNRHLRHVLKVSRMQNWVYVEKNLTDNKWYWYTHQKRRAAVQELLRMEREINKNKERVAFEASEMVMKLAVSKREEYLNKSINYLQNVLVENINKIREFEGEEGLKSIVCYDGNSGGINLAWYNNNNNNINNNINNNGEGGVEEGV